VDASPIREVEGAYLAGLGRRGKNGQLFHEKYGSYCFIGEIVTDLVIKGDLPEQGDCPGCGRCLAACPTGALKEGGVEKDRCRSHITQKKGELTDWEADQIALGGMAWGCDICTQACPLNAHPAITPIGAFHQKLLPVLTGENLPEALDDHALNYRGEKVLRRNLQILARGHHG